MRILYIIDSLKRGGKEKQLVELAKNLSPEKQIYILTFDEKIEYEEIVKQNITFFYYTKKKKSYTYILFLNSLLNKIKPDIVHTWDLNSSIMSGFVLKLKGITHINGCLRGSAYLSRFSLINFKYSLSFTLSDRVIANSQAGLKAKNKHQGRKYRVIYNGYELEKNTLKENTSYKEILNINNQKVVGMVSTFRDGKDYETFIKVAKKIQRERDDITFILVGDGPQYVKIKQKVSENENNRIIFLGKQYDVINIIQSFDICVLLSYITPHHGEGISNSIMEYMALRKPIITSDCGGNIELIKNQYNGLVVKSKDPKDFYFKLIELLDNKPLQEKLGNNAYKTLKNNFSIHKMVNNYCEIYSEFNN